MPAEPIPLPHGGDMLDLCCGNEAAADFLVRWHGYCHRIDDVVDEGYAPEKFIGCLAHAIEVYAHPFFAANAQSLRLVAGTITNAYADSVAWEQDPAGWRFKLADVLRFAGVEMTMAVVLRCGGFEHLRRVSPSIRDFAWQRQHTFQGEPH